MPKENLMAYSSAVPTSDTATTTQYNNVRNDALGLITSANAGENLTAIDAVYFTSAGTWKKGDNSNPNFSKVRGFVVTTVTSGNPATIKREGNWEVLVALLSGQTYIYSYRER